MTLTAAPNIRSRLILLVLACIVPAALMAVLLISNDYRISRADFISSAAATARANAMELDKEFAIIESALTALATSPSLASGDLRAFDAQARRLAQKLNIFNLVLEDASGQQLINTYRPFGAALPRNSTDRVVAIMQNHRAPFVSNYFVGPVSQRQLASVGVPVERATGGFYLLSATLPAQRFGTLLQQQNYPRHWITSILDRNGVIVARSVDMRRYAGTSAIPEVLRRLKEQPDGAFETSSIDGKPVLAVLARAGTSGWTVAIGIPLDNLHAALRYKLWSVILATVALLGAGLVLAWRIGTKIRRAIHDLVAPALALGAGQPVLPASYAMHEANEVGDALVKASHMLRLATHQASHDGLTGIANRAMFSEALERQVALCERRHGSLAVLYLDLDNFKTINDTHGHGAGDALLRQAAARLASQLRKSDMAARLGGDEFAVLLLDGGVAETAAVVEKLSQLMAQPYHIDGLRLLAGASIGSASFPASGGSAAALMAHADQAMYQHKLARKHDVPPTPA